MRRGMDRWEPAVENIMIQSRILSSEKKREGYK